MSRNTINFIIQGRDLEFTGVDDASVAKMEKQFKKKRGYIFHYARNDGSHTLVRMSDVSVLQIMPEAQDAPA